MRSPFIALGAAAAALGFAASATAETPVERGRYLVETIAACGNCHTPKGPQGDIPGMELAGGFVIEEPHFTAVAPNITQDAETGIGTWSEDDIVRALREGLRPDGSLIGPPMPFVFYRGISDTDARAIAAYLKTVDPIRNETAASEYRIELPPAYGPPVDGVDAPPRTDTVAYGAYLAGPVGHCMECHTPRAEGSPMPDFDRFGAGGFELPAPGGGTIVSANITPDQKTGLGAWSDDEIKAAITKGVRPDGSELVPLMPFASYARMHAEDLDAIVAYLRTLEPIEHAVK